jgi:hypothetical protein
MGGTVPPLPQYIFMAWCLVKNRDNFTFTSPYLSISPHVTGPKLNDFDPTRSCKPMPNFAEKLLISNLYNFKGHLNKDHMNIYVYPLTLLTFILIQFKGHFTYGSQ